MTTEPARVGVRSEAGGGHSPVLGQTEGMVIPARERPERRIELRLHEPSPCNHAWYDAELDMPHSPAHMAMVFALGSVFRVLAEELELSFLCDNPMWVLDLEREAPKVVYPDLVLLGPGSDVARASAEDALWVAEVVSIERKVKELKDSVLQRARCELAGVPEFALFYPEPSDGRALSFSRLVNGTYETLEISPGASVASTSIPGLELRVRPKETWRPGQKIDILFRGEPRLPLSRERARAEAERQRAEDERQRAEAAEVRAAAEAGKAAALASRLDEARRQQQALLAKLRARGIDPDGL